MVPAPQAKDEEGEMLIVNSQGQSKELEAARHKENVYLLW